MSKVDVSKIVSEMRELYKKDKRVQNIVGTGDELSLDISEKDVIPMPEAHPLRTLMSLPGLPLNKIIQVAGKPDCGKSTWAAECMMFAQKNGCQVILFDSEQKFDPARFKSMGGDPSELLLIKTNETLKGGELVRRYINAIKKQDKDAKILFVWDSVGGSQSRSHAERELDSESHAQPGQDAKENGSVMKMITGQIMTHPDSLAVLLVNQTYAKIGFMQKGDAASGGTKIEYHSSMIVMLKRIKILTKTVKGVVTKYGIVTRATASKNHISQNKTSTHQLDFQVTAEGSKLVDSVEDSEDE